MEYIIATSVISRAEMGQFVLYAIFCSIFLVAVGSFEPTYATIFQISDAASCTALGGTWVASTCTLSNSLIVDVGDTLIVDSGVTIEFASDKNLKNLGSIINNGIITINGNSLEEGVLNNTDSATFTNAGTINLSGGSGDHSGRLIIRDTSTFTNSGIINLVGGGGQLSGGLIVKSSSTFTNTNTIIIIGNAGQTSGHLGLMTSGKFFNSGTISVTGGSGIGSGLIDNWDAGSFSNSGTITITGDVGANSGRVTNMGSSSFSNTGILSIIGGSGSSSGKIINSASGNFMNLKTITITAGGPLSKSGILVEDDSTFTNHGTVNIAKNLENSAKTTNFGSLIIGNDLKNPGTTINNCGTITIIGLLIGNKIEESKCGNFHDVHEDPTIGKTSWGLQVVENGICIDIRCWTVTDDYHQDFELVEMLSNSIHTISTTVFCQNGVSKCNYVAFGVSPYGTNINDSVWKIILQKDHKDKWTMTVIDPDGYLGDVSSTTQIINDGKHLGASITAFFIKPNPGMILNVETRDSYGGYRDFQFNDGIAIKDVFAYPTIETSYEKPLQVESLCLYENSNKRYTCAFDKVREWTIKNAENSLSKMK